MAEALARDDLAAVGVARDRRPRRHTGGLDTGWTSDSIRTELRGVTVAA